MSDPQHKKTTKPRVELTARELNRQARKESRKSARRKIWFASIVALAIVIGAIAVSWVQLRPQETPPEPVELVPEVGASALVVIEHEGEPSAILFVGATVDQPSRLATVPQTLLSVVPGFGEQTLTQAYTFGGADLLALTVMNLTGARIDYTATLTSTEFAALFSGPLEIDLERPLIIQEGDVQRVIAGEGLQPRTPEMMVRLLTEKGTDNDLELMFRQGEVWEAVFAAVAASNTLADAFIGDATDSGRKAITGAAQDPEIVIGAFPVVKVNALASGEERYSLDVADAGAFIESAMPYLIVGERPRLVVEILNGNGGVGVTQPIARTFVLQGYRVLRTDNAGTDDYPTTQVIAQGREKRDAALRAQSILGYGEVVLEVRQPSGVVDLTIIVGQDSP